MKKLIIDKVLREEILRMHGFIKEQMSPDDTPPGQEGSIYNADGSLKQNQPTQEPEKKQDQPPQEPQKVEEKGDQIFIDAINNGCLKGPKSKIRKGQKSGKFIYVETASSGKIVYFYTDGTWTLQDGSKKGKWSCPEIKKQSEEKKAPVVQTGANVVQTGANVPQTPLEPKEKELQKMTSSQAKSALDGVLIKLTTDFSLNSCQELVDSYFEAAQDGEPNPKLDDYKEAVYRCNRNHMKDWKKETKDKLRWLRGDEQDARKFAGLFKRFSKDFGTITSDTKRVQWILDRLPKVN